MDMYSDQDYESVTVLTTRRRSRKLRTCETCRGEIRPGDEYLRRFLPPRDIYDRTLTVIEHASAGTCWALAR